MPTFFASKVFEQCRKIPRGKVTTYKKIAYAIGRKSSFRAVGNALNKNKKPKIIPCHRVIRTNGQIGGYAKGEKIKKSLLRKEGIEIKNNRIDLSKYLYLPKFKNHT